MPNNQTQPLVQSPPLPFVLVDGANDGPAPVEIPDSKALAAPESPPRPSSAPPGEAPHVDLQQEAHSEATHVKDDQLTSPMARKSSTTSSHKSQDDEKKSGRAKRFVGNMLVARLGRAGVQSVTSTVKLPMYLSPWGDNNPFTLPNLRKRDLALAGVMHFGADALIGSSMTAIETVIQHGASWTAEQAADQGMEKIRGAKPHKVMRTAGVTNVEIRIKHKLIGEEAVLRLFEEKNAAHKLSCAKGWFCPYLYASGRTPILSRMKDFTFAELVGPGLIADANLAPTLLSCITQEDAPVCHLEISNAEDQAERSYQRLAVFFLGISPYRTASAWSQSRIPNEARLRFHILTHVPAIVLPIKSGSTPVCAWSPWTMGQIISGRDEYDQGTHEKDMLRYLETLVDDSLIDKRIENTWRQELASSLNKMLKGIRNMPSTLGSIADVFDSERAGIVLFRY